LGGGVLCKTISGQITDIKNRRRKNKYFQEKKINRTETSKENSSVKEIIRKNAYDAGLKKEKDKTGGNQ
jgi:hypothetical protein